MEIVKELPVEAGVNLAPDRDAREHWVVVVKATYLLPEGSDEPVLAAEQAPIVYADEYLGEPGLSSIATAYDFAPEKPFGEFLLTGSAISPDGRPVTELLVGFKVDGLIAKTIRVVGDRIWREGLVPGISPSAPAPFTRMPLTYERAFGGIEADGESWLIARTSLASGFGARGTATPRSANRCPTSNIPTPAAWSWSATSRRPSASGPFHRHGCRVRASPEPTTKRGWTSVFLFCQWISIPASSRARLPISRCRSLPAGNG